MFSAIFKERQLLDLKNPDQRISIFLVLALLSENPAIQLRLLSKEKTCLFGSKELSRVEPH